MTTLSQVKPAGTPTWTDLLTPNPDGARAFYHAIFGWEYDIGGPEYGGYTTNRLGSRNASGLSGMPPHLPPQATAWGLYFATHNIEADVARAVELGASVVYPVMAVEPFGSMVTLKDPTGAMFSLWQAKMHVGWQVVNEPGSVAWHELYTADAKTAKAFYAALLGASADPMPGGLEYYVMKHGDDSLCGIMQIDPAWGAMPTCWVNYFAVANADESAALITKLGGKIMGPVDDSPFGRIAAAMDPYGAMFKIIQPPAQ